MIALPLADPRAYVERYSEPDKKATGLGAGAEAWPAPYWTVDASMSVMTMLLAAEDAGLGALFFGVFRGERELRRALGIPPVMQLLGRHRPRLAGRRRRAAAARPTTPAPAVRAGRSARQRRRRPTRSSTVAAGASAEMRLASIGLAGAAGRSAATGIGQAVGPRSFPWATLGINVAGAFVARLRARRSRSSTAGRRR